MGKTAMTAAERQRVSREKIKADRLAYERYKEIDRTRKVRKRLAMDNIELNQLRVRTKCSMQRLRNRKQASESIDENETPAEVYRNKSSLTKAKNRVKCALPNSPRKLRVVLKQLASDVGIHCTIHSTSGNALDSDTVQAVIGYYENDSISRMMPGKADTIVVRTNGTKATCQKRHVVMTIGEAYQSFKRDHPTMNIGKSKFAELRPEYVRLASEMPHNVCGCKYHNNMILLLECLHRRYPDKVPLYKRDIFLPLSVCDATSEQCMSNKCQTCDNGQRLKAYLGELPNTDDQVQWMQWITKPDGYVDNVSKSSRVSEVISELLAQLPRFLWHVFIKHEQEISYAADKAQATRPDSTTCLVQMDFLENFTLLQQDEIQSAHWNQQQVTIYTVMIWNREITIPWVMISDCREHEKSSITAFTHKVLIDVKIRMPHITSVFIWTDGPSSQYKNRFIFCVANKLTAHHKLNIKWQYFATSHGKGPNDALGGNVKRIVHRQMMSKSTFVNDAASFAMALQNGTDNIKVSTVTQGHIDNICQLLHTSFLWENLKPIPGTINVHQLITCPERDAIQTSFYRTGECTTVVFQHQVSTDARKQKSRSKAEGKVKKKQPLRKKSSVVLLSTSTSDNVCTFCKVEYGDPNDPRAMDEWLKCVACKIWLHETCAESNGVLDDDYFTCRACFV